LPFVLRFCSEGNKDKREFILQYTIVILRYYKMARKVMKRVITHQVENNTEDGFRILHVYNRLYFSNYLRSALASAMQDTYQVIKQTAEMPSDLRHPNIILIAQHIVECIEGTIDIVPSHLADLCAHMLYASDIKTVGNVIFNHFFNPAIVFPENYQLWPTAPSLKERNVLVAVSKLIQKLVSGREFLSTVQGYLQYNQFLKDHHPLLLKFLADMATVKEKEEEDMQAKLQRLSMTRKTSNLDTITCEDLNSALSKISTILSDMFAYFPLPSDISENSYLHIIRTEEILEKLETAQTREEFLQIMERLGTIVVPIEWVLHKKKMKLAKMSDMYTKISEKQIDLDLQRDTIVINDKHVFKNETFAKVHSTIAQELMNIHNLKDINLANAKAMSMLQMCGRTSSAGDAYDAILHVFGKNKNITIVADQSAETMDLPVSIVIDKHVVHAEQTNSYRVIDHYFSQTSVWCKITATTKWEFITANVTKQQLSTGIVILKYVGVDSSTLSGAQMEELQNALFAVYKSNSQALS